MNAKPEPAGHAAEDLGDAIARDIFELLSAGNRTVLDRDPLKALTGHLDDILDAIAAMDDVVDDLRNRVLHDLLDLMIKDPQMVPRALELLIVARHLERADDHLTNVCERIVYMVTGELRELNV